MSLEMTVFNVGRGLCVSLRTPNGYCVMIDCGASDELDPVDFLAFLHRKGAFRTWNEYPLTYFVVTHPHSDHLSAIASVNDSFRPAIILRRKDLDWDRVRRSNQSNVAFDYFREDFLPPKYSEPAQLPDFGDGMTLETQWLGIRDVEVVSGSDTSYVNNSSCVLIVHYRGYTIAIHGDLESEGCQRLLAVNDPLRAGLETTGVDFLVCPHHGHKSGFCKTWFHVAGPTRKFNIVSERRRGRLEMEQATAIDARYSSPDCSSGDNREAKRMVSTKGGLTTIVRIHDNGTWSWEQA